MEASVIISHCYWIDLAAIISSVGKGGSLGSSGCVFLDLKTYGCWDDFMKFAVIRADYVLYKRNFDIEIFVVVSLDT